MTYQEMCEKVAKMILNGEIEYDLDNSGQILFYTDIYVHKDGSIQEVEDPTYEE